MSKRSVEEGKSMKNSDLDEEEEEEDPSVPESRRDKNELQQGRTGANNEADIIAEFNEENFLFEVQLSLTNFVSCTLTIPRETAEKYFLAADTITHPEINLLFSSKYDEQWPMKFLNPQQPGALLFITEWSQFFGAHKLKAMDLIRFYKPIQPLHNQHYLLDCLKYLFQKELTATDIRGMLQIPTDDADDEQNHFPRLDTSESSEEMLQISDAQNKNWEMKFKVAPVATAIKKHGYRITWRRFVVKHQLEAADVIFFYKPVPPSNDKRYAIRFGKAHKGG